MLGEDGEATVDGIHFTDLGMMRYADLVCPIIKKAINNDAMPTTIVRHYFRSHSIEFLSH